MLNKYIVFTWMLFLLCIKPVNLFAQMSDDNLGQSIEINTQLHSFVGKPSWLLIVRDLDHNQVLPYLYDIRRGNNHWMAFTRGHHYLITASELRFYPYRWKIKNFCGLESRGKISRGESLYINLSGDLAPYNNTYNCNVSRFSDPNFAVANPDLN